MPPIGATGMLSEGCSPNEQSIAQRIDESLIYIANVSVSPAAGYLLHRVG